MKIEISKTELLRALEVAGRALDAKSPQPIYAALMLETVGDYLQLTGTDGEITLTALAAFLPGGEPGKVAVIGEGFITVVKGLVGPLLSLSVEKNGLVVKSGRSRYVLPVLVGEAWPVVPLVEDRVSFTVNEKRLAAALGRVVPAIGADESRPALSGTYWVAAERLSLVATDTHRLHLARVPLGVACGQGSFILGARASRELARVLTSEFGDCKVSTDGACVKVVTMSGIFVSRLIAEKYVNYERFIPEGSDFAEFSQPELAAAIRRASFVAAGAADRLVVSLPPGGPLRLEATSDLFGEAEEELPVLAGGAGPHRFALSSRNLGAAVAAVPDTVVRLYRSPQARGILVSGDSTDDFFAVCIQMSLPADR